MTNFDHLLEVFHGLFFCFPLIAKKCTGDEVGMGNGVHLDEAGEGCPEITIRAIVKHVNIYVRYLYVYIR